MVKTIDPGDSEPTEARSAMIPVGSSARFDVLMAKNSAMALVAVPGRGFSASSSIIALMPNGVAALPKPSMLEVILRIIMLMAGCSAGTSGKSQHITGRNPRANACRSPPSCRTRISPSQRAITPTRPEGQCHGRCRALCGGLGDLVRGDR